MKLENLVFFAFTLLGLALGITSHLVLLAFDSPELAGVMAIAAILAFKKLLELWLKIRRKAKWWVNNGIAQAIITWFVIWTILYNVYFVKP